MILQQKKSLALLVQALDPELSGGVHQGKGMLFRWINCT